MASVWSAQTPFCPRCGTLLVFPDVGDVVCDACDYACRMRDMPALTVVTRSYPKPVPEWLAEYHAAEAARAGGPAAALGDKKAKRAVVNEECPKCKSPRMEFYTMQLRSADEGQTVRAAGGGVQSCARAVLPSRCTARRLTARRLVVPSRPPCAGVLRVHPARVRAQVLGQHVAGRARRARPAIPRRSQARRRARPGWKVPHTAHVVAARLTSETSNRQPWARATGLC